MILCHAELAAEAVTRLLGEGSMFTPTSTTSYRAMDWAEVELYPTFSVAETCQFMSSLIWRRGRAT
jgi:hypothetical protein